MAPDDDSVSETEELEIEEVEVSGIVTDKFGNTWTVPADNVEDEYSFNIANPMDFPNKDPRFDYQWIRDDQLPGYMALGHVPVTREDAGYSPMLVKEYGGLTDNYLRGGGMIAVKIPIQLAKRRRDASVREAKEAVDMVGPTPEMVEKAKSIGIRTATNAKVTKSNKLTD